MTQYLTDNRQAAEHTLFVADHITLSLQLGRDSTLRSHVAGAEVLDAGQFD